MVLYLAVIVYRPYADVIVEQVAKSYVKEKKVSFPFLHVKLYTYVPMFFLSRSGHASLYLRCWLVSSLLVYPVLSYIPTRL